MCHISFFAPGPRGPAAVRVLSKDFPRSFFAQVAHAQKEALQNPPQEQVVRSFLPHQLRGLGFLSKQNRSMDSHNLVFFLQEPGRNWEDVKKEKEHRRTHDSHGAKHHGDHDPHSDTDADDPWDDWTEQVDDATVCLFCPETLPSPVATCAHMVAVHNFDLPGTAVQLKLSVYDRIKLVNYIRHQVRRLKLFNCFLLKSITNPR
jgi:hypothetical protein